MNKVAVYGTLRQGFHNNYLLGKSLYLGLAKAGFPSVMYSAGGFPKLDLTKNHLDVPVTVEVYEVPDAILQGPLDGLEGYPGWYDRSEQHFTLESGEVVKAWIYHQEVGQGMPEVTSGDWAEFAKFTYELN